MRPSFLASVALTLLLSVGACRPEAAAAGEPVAELLRGKLVVPRGKALVPLPEEALAGKKFYALYFSAGWCPPCHVFTPKLIGFYQAIRARHPEFEVVFVSEDESAEAMREYMVKFGMPFPALRFDALPNAPRIVGLRGPGIPSLVLVNASSKVLAHTFAGDRSLGPDRVLVEIQKRLAASGG